MLQIIGWLGCVYLVVKGLEILSSSAHRTAEGKLNQNAIAAAVIAFVAAAVFVLLLNSQASSTGTLSSVSSSSPNLYIPNASATADPTLTSLEMNATDMNATANADEALNAAGEEMAPTNVDAKY